MLFNSFEFFVFFPVVTLIYFVLPHKFRWLHLLAASCIFYMAFVPVYILILLVTIIIDYIAGLMIENAAGSRRKWFLVMSIVANVGMLAFFKYYNFFVENVNELCTALHCRASVPFLNIVLPIGLSFHTFQAMSYTIEVYRGKQKAERHFGIYALYVMFYPQLVAGPIERPQNLLHQFHEPKKFDYTNVATGLRLMLWGLFKKLIIADRLSGFVDLVFNHPAVHSGIVLAIAAVFFSFQIFCDFSGYSDIAIGAARVMGFHLMTNFNMPYHSRSVSEFWKRWHISLSTWFKDYLYISLGGNRVSIRRVYFNLFFVFLVSGFWHGANWTFIIWGALNGFYIIFALFTHRLRERINRFLKIKSVHWLDNTLNIGITFGLITFAWIFFRANNLADALQIISRIFRVPREMIRVVATRRPAPDLPALKGSILLRVGLILILEAAHLVTVRYRLGKTFGSLPGPVRWSLYFTGVYIILFFGIEPGYHQFIYFQF